MLDEEIRVAVVKEMQMEKDKQSIRQLVRDKAYGHFKLRTSSPAKLVEGSFPGDKSHLGDDSDPNKSEALLDPKTLSKIDRLYRGVPQGSHLPTRSKQIISEILDVGRMDFLKTQKVSGKGQLRFPRAGKSLAQTQAGPWTSAINGRMAMSPPSAKVGRTSLGNTAGCFTDQHPMSQPQQNNPASSRIAGSKIFTPGSSSGPRNSVANKHLFSPSETERSPPRKLKDLAKMRQSTVFILSFTLCSAPRAVPRM